MLWLSVANKDVYIIYCLLFTYSALSVTYLPPRGATVHALNRKSVKNKEFPVPLYWVSLLGTLSMLAQGTTNINQILHGDQIMFEETFYRVDHVTYPGQIFDRNADARSVCGANLHVYNVSAFSFGNYLYILRKEMTRKPIWRMTFHEVKGKVCHTPYWSLGGVLIRPWARRW